MSRENVREAARVSRTQRDKARRRRIAAVMRIMATEHSWLL